MTKFQKFNDGVVDIYSVSNIAQKGDRPKEGLLKKYHLCFGYRTIGIKRNYVAMQSQVSLSELISIPIHRDISSQDIAVINGMQYRIEQAQQITDTLPPTTLLSLSRLEADYDLKGI